MSQEVSRLRAERDEALSAVAETRRELETAEAQLKEKGERIGELERRINQLKTTIRVQSDQIQGPRETNTPHRGGAAGAYWRPPAYKQAPPVFPGLQTVNHSAIPPPAVHHRSKSFVAPTPQLNAFPPPSFNPPERPQTAFRTESFGQPAQSQVSFRSGSFVTPVQGQRVAPYAPGPPYQFSSGTSGFPYGHHSTKSSGWLADPTTPQFQHDVAAESRALSIHGDDSSKVAWSTEFSQFFKLTEEWARNYTNVPDQERDKGLPEGLISAFAKHSDISQVMPLLGSGATRYFLVAKLINSWITNDIFRPQALRGFSRTHDNKISELRHQIQPGIPPHLRFALMVAIADTAKEMKEVPGFYKYVEGQVSSKTSNLWDRLTYLVAPGVLQSQAWDDLSHIHQESYRIAILMMCTPLGHNFTYPHVSVNTFFNPSCMLNRDISFKGDPLSLKRQDLRVRLGITPIIVITNYMTPSVVPQTVHFSNVLLMR